MDSTWLSNILILVAMTLMTAAFWFHTTKKEGFDNTQAILDSVIGSAADTTQQDKPPTDTEAVNHYKALLVYISTDFSKGLRIVYDLNKRVYGSANKVPEDFDPRDVIKNFKNPITGPV